MKIVHVSLSGSFTEGWSYHENLLPFWHRALGNEVTLITRNTMHEGVKIIECPECEKTMEDGVKLIRLHVKQKKVNSWSKPNKKLFLEALEKEKPDCIWLHGVMNPVLPMIVTYKKKTNNSVIVVCDNHADSSNYANDIFRRINLIYFSHLIKKSLPYVKWFYGVTPGRCDFLEKQLRIPKEKILLSMQGGNPNEIDYLNKDAIRKSFRVNNGLSEADFIYCVGGKLTKEKKVFELIESFKTFKNPNLRLVVFGAFATEEDTKRLKSMQKDDKRIVFLGFLNAIETSNVFLASDVGIFPGRHSVLWEKALSCGLPCLFEQKKGYEHLFFGGGALKINDICKEPLNVNLGSFQFSNDFLTIRENATKNRNMYLYDFIAKKTLKEIFENDI